MPIEEKPKSRLTIKTKAILITVLDLIMIILSIYKWVTGIPEASILWVIYIIPLAIFLLSFIFECVYFDCLLEGKEPNIKAYEMGFMFCAVGMAIIIGLTVMFWVIVGMFFDVLHTALPSI